MPRAISFKKETEVSLARIVLGVLVVGGVVAFASIAPNAVQLFGPLLKKKPQYAQASRIRRALADLKRQGLVEKKTGESWTATAAGKRLVELADGAATLAQEKWDGKWRVVMFDIPEEKRAVRNRLREYLAMAGFLQLKNSAWVYPYPVGEYVALVTAELRLSIGTELLVLETGRFTGDARLHKAFKLSER